MIVTTRGDSLSPATEEVLQMPDRQLASRDRVQCATFGAIGLFAGIGLWIIAGLILMLCGFSFYAVHLAAYAALALWAIAAPVIYLNARKASPHRAYHRVAPLLVGAGVTVTFLAVIWAIGRP